jgi:hypothetical protein
MTRARHGERRDGLDGEADAEIRRAPDDIDGRESCHHQPERVGVLRRVGFRVHFVFGGGARGQTKTHRRKPTVGCKSWLRDYGLNLPPPTWSAINTGRSHAAHFGIGFQLVTMNFISNRTRAL